MSVVSGRTSISSILKSFNTTERDRAKTAIINKVRFELPKNKGLLEAVKEVLEYENYRSLEEFVQFLLETDLSREEFIVIFRNARSVANKLTLKFTTLVEALLAVKWVHRTPEEVRAYSEFCIDIMVRHNNYIAYGLPRLIALWVPADDEAHLWPGGTPTEECCNILKCSHQLLENILAAVPLTFDATMEAVDAKFPYYKKPMHAVAGYVHNLLWLQEYKPMSLEHLLQLLLQKFLTLDVNAPRCEIEEAEEENEAQMDESMFKMEETQDESIMNHSIAHTLDICMEKIFAYMDTLKAAQDCNKDSIFFKMLLKVFNTTILPSHQTNHTQFLIFYYCSLNEDYAELFMMSLWEIARNPNSSPIVRQSAVNYMASFLARSKYISYAFLCHYLKEFCEWSHQYIHHSNRLCLSLRANLVFYTICQAVFYVIAFRSRTLTADPETIAFLQSLQLTALVTSTLNPLRVCLPAVANAFAHVTRKHQLAYCHAILERNARHKLATIYANDASTPEESLDTYFPFDPYLLKLSGKRIEQIYIQYQPSD